LIGFARYCEILVQNQGPPTLFQFFLSFLPPEERLQLCIDLQQWDGAVESAIVLRSVVHTDELVRWMKRKLGVVESAMYLKRLNKE
jgi:hypothetical protein